MDAQRGAQNFKFFLRAATSVLTTRGAIRRNGTVDSEALAVSRDVNSFMPWPCGDEGRGRVGASKSGWPS
jgi:hypothetical protein